MRMDDLASGPPPRAPLPVRGPAQRAISEFLTVHRALQPNNISDRVFGFSPLTDLSSEAFRRALSQLRVASLLDDLGSGWAVFHGVMGPMNDDGEASTIDHVVVGPAGVIAVTVYDHAGHRVEVDRRTFVLDGHRLPYIRVAETEVGHIERMLATALGEEVTANAVIALIDPSSLSVRSLPPDVAVINSRELVPFVRGASATVEAGRVQQIAEVIASNTPWVGWSESSSEDAALAASEREEFFGVQRQVATARVVRACWAAAAACLLAAVVVGMCVAQFADASHF